MDDLLLLRNNIKKFANVIINDIEPGKIVLEYGPMVQSLMRYPDEYVDIRNEVTKKKSVYKSSDIYQSHIIDYVTDIHNSPNIINQKFDYIIALDVIEHVKKVWKVPEILYNMLNDSGKIYISSPYYFRIHGPSPDCWRFTDQGLIDLFEDFFTINSITACCNGDDKKPLHYTLIATKKEII